MCLVSFSFIGINVVWTLEILNAKTYAYVELSWFKLKIFSVIASLLNQSGTNLINLIYHMLLNVYLLFDQNLLKKKNEI